MTAILEQFPVIDLLALAWLLLGVLAGLLRGLSRTFGALLWVLLSLWLSTTLAPVLLGLLANTEGTDRPEAHLLAYGCLIGLSLGVPLFGRLLGSRRGLPKRSIHDARDKGLGVVAGLLAALLTLSLMVPFVGQIEPLGQAYPTARSPRLVAQILQLLPWLYPSAFRVALAEQRSAADDMGPLAEPSSR